MRVEVLDPRVDAVPARWAEYWKSARLYAPWDFSLLGLESSHSPNPQAVAVATVDGRVVGAMLATVLRFRGMRLLEVHSPWMPGIPGWSWPDDLGVRHRRSVLRRMERALCRFAGLRCVGLLYRFVDAGALPLISGVGRLARPTMGTSVLDNTFGTVDDWVSSLKRSRRHSLRGQIRKVDRDPDLVVRFEPARHDLDGAELADLVNSHRDRLGKPKFDQRGTLSGAYLHELVRRDDVFSLTYQDGAGRLLAFANMLDHPVMPMYQHWATLSKEDGGRQHLYFDSYARMMRHVVDDRRSALTAGRGMLDVKGSLGLATRPLWAVAVPRPVAG